MIRLKLSEIIEATGGKLLSGDSSITVAEISTNSRKISNDCLFLALKGERFDGNDFIADAFENGAVDPDRQRSGKYSRQITGKGRRYLKALHDIASYIRDRFAIPFIGITGSVGKPAQRK